MNTVVSNDEQSTIKAGSELAKKLKAQDVVFLHGELGSGKTTFTKGIAQGLGIRGRIISPTFVVVRTHEIDNLNSGKDQNIKTLYHLDLYRLENEKDAAHIDLKDFLQDENGVVVIEWPEVGQSIVGKKVWRVEFSVLDEENRRINISYE